MAFVEKMVVLKQLTSGYIHSRSECIGMEYGNW